MNYTVDGVVIYKDPALHAAHQGVCSYHCMVVATRTVFLSPVVETRTVFLSLVVATPYTDSVPGDGLQ